MSEPSDPEARGGRRTVRIQPDGRQLHAVATELHGQGPSDDRRTAVMPAAQEAPPAQVALPAQVRTAARPSAFLQRLLVVGILLVVLLSSVLAYLVLWKRDMRRKLGSPPAAAEPARPRTAASGTIVAPGPPGQGGVK